MQIKLPFLEIIFVYWSTIEYDINSYYKVYDICLFDFKLQCVRKYCTYTKHLNIQKKTNTN